MTDILGQIATCSFVGLALGECISGAEQWSNFGAKLSSDGPASRGRKLSSTFPDEFLLAVRAEIRRADEGRASISVDVTNSAGQHGNPRTSSGATFTRDDPLWNSSFPPLGSTVSGPSPAKTRSSGVESAFARPVQPIASSKPSRRIVVTKVCGPSTALSTPLAGSAPVPIVAAREQSQSHNATQATPSKPPVSSTSNAARSFAGVLTGSTGAALAEFGGQIPAARPALPHHNAQAFPSSSKNGAGEAGHAKAWSKPAHQPTVSRPNQKPEKAAGPVSPDSGASPRRRPTVLSEIGEGQTAVQASTLCLSHDAPQSGGLASRTGQENCHARMEDPRQLRAGTCSSEGPNGRPQAFAIQHPSAGTRRERAGPTATCGVESRDALCRIAKVHSALLRSCSDIALLPEAEYLLHVIARGELNTVPGHARNCEDGSRDGLFCCRNVAASYACMVLEHSGNLLRALGVSVLGALVASPIVVALSPTLTAKGKECLQGEAARDSEDGQHPLEDQTAPSPLCLHVKPEHGHVNRMPEELMRNNNREACRDEWMSIMREAAGTSHHHTAVFKAGEEDETAFRVFRGRAPSLLANLRPDNYPSFAAMFVESVLQAAATGEAFPDDELSQLASRDLSKFARLQERIKGKGCEARQTASSWPGSRRSGRPRDGTGAPGEGGPLLLRFSSVVGAFPRHQRLFVLFLLVADSYRLNTCLARCMQAKLVELCQQEREDGGLRRGSGSAVWKLMAALALHLSFLHFSAAGADPTDRWGTNIEEWGPADCVPLFNVEDHLNAAMKSDTMLPTLFWALRYFWFAAWDTAAASCPTHRRTLALLAQAQKHPALLPGSAQFDGAMLCARGLLDEFMERARSTQLPLLDREPASPVPTGALVSALRGSHLEAVLFHLCCRGLRKGCRALQGDSCRGQDPPAAKSLRRIRPSQPLHSLSSRAPTASQPSKDAAMRELEEAFIDMYSHSGKVRMNDLVAQVSTITASNAAQAALRCCCSQQAVAAIPAVRELLSSPGEVSLLSPASKKNLVLNDINDLLPSAAELSLQACLRFAEADIRSCAAASFSVLACPDWTAAVAGTGAALAAQRATAKCTQKLVNEVPGCVRTSLMLLLRTAMKQELSANGQKATEDN